MRAVALLERGARIAGGLPFRLRRRERDKAATQEAEIALREAGRAQVPTGVGPERSAQRHRPDAVDLVAVSVHRGYQYDVAPLAFYRLGWQNGHNPGFVGGGKLRPAIEVRRGIDETIVCHAGNV